MISVISHIRKINPSKYFLEVRTVAKSFCKTDVWSSILMPWEPPYYNYSIQCIATCAIASDFNGHVKRKAMSLPLRDPLFLLVIDSKVLNYQPIAPQHWSLMPSCQSNPWRERGILLTYWWATTDKCRKHFEQIPMKEFAEPPLLQALPTFEANILISPTQVEEAFKRIKSKRTIRYNVIATEVWKAKSGYPTLSSVTSSIGFLRCGFVSVCGRQPDMLCKRRVKLL